MEEEAPQVVRPPRKPRGSGRAAMDVEGGGGGGGGTALKGGIRKRGVRVGKPSLSRQVLAAWKKGDGKKKKGKSRFSPVS